MKRILIITSLMFLGFVANAQNFPVYEPIRRGGNTPKKQVKEEQLETLEAYTYNSIAKSWMKLKIQVSVTDLGILIRKYKKLADVYWTPVSGTVSKLNSYDEQSKLFEYKGYVTGIGMIYF